MVPRLNSFGLIVKSLVSSTCAGAASRCTLVVVPWTLSGTAPNIISLSRASSPGTVLRAVVPDRERDGVGADDDDEADEAVGPPCAPPAAVVDAVDAAAAAAPAAVSTVVIVAVVAVVAEVTLVAVVVLLTVLVRRGRAWVSYSVSLPLPGLSKLTTMRTCVLPSNAGGVHLGYD